MFDNVFILDDDVSFYHYDQYMEALFTKSNPVKDIWMVGSNVGSHTPSFTIGHTYWEKEDLEGKIFRMTVPSGGRNVFDATTKEEPKEPYVNKTAFETLYPDDLQEWVVENWERLGFKEGVDWNKPYEEMTPLLEV